MRPLALLWFASLALASPATSTRCNPLVAPPGCRAAALERPR